MACEFTSYQIVFQPCQDNGWVIMKGCVQWTPPSPLTIKNIPTSSGSRIWDRQISRPALYLLSFQGHYFWNNSQRVSSRMETPLYFFFFFLLFPFEVFKKLLFCCFTSTVLLFYVHGKQLRSCRDGQLT